MSTLILIPVGYIVGAIVTAVGVYAFFGDDPDNTVPIIVAWPVMVVLAILFGVIWVLFRGPRALGLKIYSWVEEMETNETMAEDR